MPTLISLHVDRWKGCTQCRLHKTRQKVVLWRGKMPADVVLCGEGPGLSEDSHGVPFVGAAGGILDRIIARCIPPQVRYAITNMVACIPVDADGNKATEPDDDCIESCKPRLEEFLTICRPRVIVCLGRVAKDWLEQGYKHSVKLPLPKPLIVDIDHPSRIGRLNVAQQGLAAQRCEVIIRNALEDAGLLGEDLTMVGGVEG